MKTFIFFVLMLSFLGCKKDQRKLRGPVNITGKLTDVISNQPLGDAVVILTLVQEKFGHLDFQFGGMDTTDALGNYEFSFNASGQYYFQLYAENG